ncbi:Hypothetical predicted protein [Cloeon dipterum]|uniref:Uncharacterized protein n=1 Tax=Cloeon dipterum TaxID=197152 RepID=A0A8S1BZE8_9INSE|nr:Hypothetical predicted protein [Cloeon dipterum]
MLLLREGSLLGLILVFTTGAYARSAKSIKEVFPVVLMARDEEVAPPEASAPPESTPDTPTDSNQEGKYYGGYPGAGFPPGIGGYPPFGGGFPPGGGFGGFPGAGYPGGFPGAGYPGGFPGIGYPGGFPGAGYPGGFPFPGRFPPYGVPYNPYWGRNQPGQPQASTAEASPSSNE